MRYDSLQAHGLIDFWKAYGAVSSTNDGVIVVSGWIETHETNRKSKLGLSLLARKAPSAVAADLHRLRLDADVFRSTGVYLCDPLPAWLQIENTPDPRGLADVHQPSVLKAYWSRLRRELADAVMPESDLDDVVQIIARLMADPATERPGYRQVMDAIRTDQTNPNLSDETYARMAVNQLKLGKLLRFRRGEAELETEFDLFWAHHIVLAAQKDGHRGRTPQLEVERLRTWQLRSDSGSWLADAVVHLSMNLLAIDQHGGDFARLVWESWMADPDLSNQPVWSAAARSNSQMQAFVAGWLHRNKTTSSGTRELYLFLRFLLMASDEALSGTERLEIAQFRYAEIGMAGYGDYFAHMAERAIALARPEDFGRTADSLVGVEETTVPERVVGSFVRHALQRREALVVLRETVAFLGSDVPANRRERTPASRASGAERPGDRDAWGHPIPQFFWQHLVEQLVETVVEDEGLGAFSLFRDAGWLRPPNRSGMPGHVEKYVRRIVHIHLGGVFRRGRQATEEDFKDLLEALINGRALHEDPRDQAERAFYILKHTAVQHGSAAARLDPSLLPVLSTLSRIPFLRKKLGKQMEAMLKANKAARRPNAVPRQRIRHGNNRRAPQQPLDDAATVTPPSEESGS